MGPAWTLCKSQRPRGLFPLPSGKGQTADGAYECQKPSTGWACGVAPDKSRPVNGLNHVPGLTGPGQGASGDRRDVASTGPARPRPTAAPAAGIGGGGGRRHTRHVVPDAPRSPGPVTCSPFNSISKCLPNFIYTRKNSVALDTCMYNLFH